MARCGIRALHIRPGGRMAGRAADNCGNKPTTGETHMNELRQKRDQYAETMRSILSKAEAGHRSLTPAEQKDFDGLQTKVNDLNQTLKRASQLGELRADI